MTSGKTFFKLRYQVNLDSTLHQSFQIQAEGIRKCTVCSGFWVRKDNADDAPQLQL
jgi:hypothetical protein